MNEEAKTSQHDAQGSKITWMQNLILEHTNFYRLAALMEFVCLGQRFDPQKLKI